LGGEEFAVALTETDMPSALETAERLCREIAAEPFKVVAGEIKLTVSVGVATRRPKDSDAAEVLRLADRALYAAKTGGRNRVIAYICDHNPNTPALKTKSSRHHSKRNGR
jgi:two-component system cell cycle response regulator